MSSHLDLLELQFFGQTCLGYIVSEGKFVQAIETTNANFGVTKDGHYIMGTLSPSDVQTLGFEDVCVKTIFVTFATHSIIVSDRISTVDDQWRNC